jgi:hypothetical protein
MVIDVPFVAAGAGESNIGFDSAAIKIPIETEVTWGRRAMRRDAALSQSNQGRRANAQQRSVGGGQQGHLPPHLWFAGNIPI